MKTKKLKLKFSHLNKIGLKITKTIRINSQFIINSPISRFKVLLKFILIILILLILPILTCNRIIGNRQDLLKLYEQIQWNRHYLQTPMLLTTEAGLLETRPSMMISMIELGDKQFLFPRWDLMSEHLNQTLFKKNFMWQSDQWLKPMSKLQMNLFIHMTSMITELCIS